MIDESQSVTEGAATKMPKKVLKKRKIEDKMDKILTLMNRIHTDTKERLKEISTRIGSISILVPRGPKCLIN